MHWISLLFSFVLGKINSAHRPPSLKEIALAILEEATYRSRKPIMLLLGGLTCILILCGGFFMSVLDLTSQYDREDGLHFTANVYSGVTLVAVALSMFFWIFTSAWPGIQEAKTPKKELPPQDTTSSLEQAISLLILDFVKEREYKREHRERPKEKDPSPLHNN